MRWPGNRGSGSLLGLSRLLTLAYPETASGLHRDPGWGHTHQCVAASLKGQETLRGDGPPC